MHYEIRNIFIYLYLAAGHVLNGRGKQGWACFMGGLYRTKEMLVDIVGSKKVTCDFCGWQGSQYRTQVATVDIRHNAICPKCLSLERHRDFFALFERVRTVFDSSGIKLLDIAPNKAFSNYCQRAPDIEYLSVDLQSQLAMRHMDIQNLDLPDDSFDVIVCYHVLDYVEDDSKGLSEIYRTLKPDGVAIIQEGMDTTVNTVEFGSALPENQYRIRQYGSDFPGLLEKANFHYYTFQPLPDSKPVFLLTKKASQMNEVLVSLLG